MQVLIGMPANDDWPRCFKIICLTVCSQPHAGDVARSVAAVDGDGDGVSTNELLHGANVRHGQQLGHCPCKHAKKAQWPQ